MTSEQMLSRPVQRRLAAACALMLAASLGAVQAQPATTQTSTAPSASAPRFSAIVRGVLDDGTIALNLGTILTPVRLSGVTLWPGAIPAIQKALPAGAHVYVQILEKGYPARGVVWVKNKSLSDMLVAQKLAAPKQ